VDDHTEGGAGGRQYGTSEKDKQTFTGESNTRLPDLEQSKNGVLNSLAAASSQESYGHAIDEFIGWYCSEPRLAFNRSAVLRYRFSRTEEPGAFDNQRAGKIWSCITSITNTGGKGSPHEGRKELGGHCALIASPQFLAAVRVGLPVPFVCNETHELGKELVGSYIVTKFISSAGSNSTITTAPVRRRSIYKG